MNAADAYRHRLTALSIAYEANISTLIWGDPGEGKSAVISAFADDRGIYHEVVPASLRDPTDFNGLPVTYPDGTVRFSPPAWLVNTNKTEGSLLVIDELSTAPPATRAAALRVIQERVSADTPLNRSTRVVAIANPPEIAEDGWELGAPMSNRFFHMRDWKLPVAVFSAGLTTGGWSRAPRLDIDLDALAAAQADANAAVAGFVGNDPSTLSRVPDHPADRQYAWPSPRTWTMLATLLGYARAATIDDAPIDDEVIELLVEGCIGTVTAPAFLSFLQALELPSPADLLANPDGWEVPARGDLAWAALSRTISYLAGKGQDATIDDWKAAGQVLAHATHGQGDVVVAVAQDWWQHARVHGPAVLPAELASGRFATVLALTDR